MKILANQDGLVALSARDSALFALRPDYKDPVSTVTQTRTRTSQVEAGVCEALAVRRCCVTWSRATWAVGAAAAGTAQTSSDWPDSPSSPTPTRRRQPAVSRSS